MTNLRDSQILNHKHNLEWNWLLIATILKVGPMLAVCTVKPFYKPFTVVVSVQPTPTRCPYTRCTLEGDLSTSQCAKHLLMSHQKEFPPLFLIVEQQ